MSRCVRGSDRLFFVSLYLYLVEAVTEHTDDFRLRHEGARVDVLDNPENVGALVLLGQYHEHLAFVLGVPSLPVEHGHAAVHFVDGGGNLVIFQREDEELDRLPAAVHNVVEQEVGDDERAVSVEQFVDTACGQQQA